MPDQTDVGSESDAAADQPDKRVVNDLRAIMDRKGVKITALAAATEVPYRSLQNYFAKKTEMPVSVYLRICKALGIDNGYVERERFELDFDALKSALRSSLGELLPRPEFKADGAMVLSPSGNQVRTEAELARHATTLAMFVRSHYDLHRERDVASNVRADGNSRS